MPVKIKEIKFVYKTNIFKVDIPKMSHYMKCDHHFEFIEILVFSVFPEQYVLIQLSETFAFPIGTTSTSQIDKNTALNIMK